jgi:hypothetical protein
MDARLGDAFWALSRAEAQKILGEDVTVEPKA